MQLSWQFPNDEDNWSSVMDRFSNEESDTGAGAGAEPLYIFRSGPNRTLPKALLEGLLSSGASSLQQDSP
jgi:hypothetical protein